MRIAALLLVAVLVAGCATPVTEIQFPAGIQATCAAEGGCAVITRAKLERRLVDAAMAGAEAAAQELQDKACRRI